MATIILTGGGTAGHCTPHLAILPYLKNDFENIYYIGSKNGMEKDIIEKENIPYYSVSCAKLERKLTIKNLKIPYTVFTGIKEAGKILDKLKPDVIFSKGGYVSVPVVIAAKKRKIPVVAHESDYTVGLANRISSKFCKKVLTSFPETAKSIKNGEYVGSPIRSSEFNSSKEKALKFFGFSGEKPIVLVTGGSTGATTINTALRLALDDITPKFDVIHVCGKNNLDNQINNKSYYQTEYLYNIGTAFTVADVCVTRAGSNALFEILSLKIPCLVIPLPKGISRGDQVLNARYFQKLGLITVLPQDSLTKDSLVSYINAVYSNRHNSKRNYDKMPITDQSRQISKILADYIHN